MISFHFCNSFIKNPQYCDFRGDSIMRFKFDFHETRNKAYLRYFEGLSVLFFTIDFILIKRNSISKKKKIWSYWTNFYREKKYFPLWTWCTKEMNRKTKQSEIYLYCNITGVSKQITIRGYLNFQVLPMHVIMYMSIQQIFSKVRCPSYVSGVPCKVEIFDSQCWYLTF